MGHSTKHATFTLVILEVILPACGSTSARTQGVDSGGLSAANSSCSPARPQAAGIAMLQFEHNGVMRDYELSIPEGYDGQTKAPVIVSLHGFTSNIAQEDAAGLDVDQASS